MVEYGTLYDRGGRSKYVDAGKVRDIMIRYEDFDVRRKAFEKEPGTHARSLLKNIQTMKRMVEEIGLYLPNHFKMNPIDLDELEEKCKGHVES